MSTPDEGENGADDARLVAHERSGDNAAPLSVAQLSAAIKRVIEQGFGHVRVRGEISGFKRAASGHIYFALKDADAKIDAVMWKGAAARIPFAAEDGLDVIVTGRITTYPGRSNYQIVVEAMELAGEGALLALLEKTKARLAAEGLFDAARKQALPFLPRVIGVVTSPTGAVIRDILHRLSDRMPTRVLVWPVLVQGNGAAAQIAAAIARLDALDGTGEGGGGIPRPDLIIVARGGGSIEDLWAFNEEVVVRAVAACRIPLISAVGHETDTTLIDFAADVRAPTPSAAAEMAVPVRAELAAELATRASRLARAWARQIGALRERMGAVADRLPSLDRLLSPQRQRLDDAAARLPSAFRLVMAGAGARLAQASAALRLPALEQRLARGHERLDAAWRLLGSLDPRTMMARGYAIVRDATGALVTSASSARSAHDLRLGFVDGEVAVSVSGDTSPPTRKPPARPSPAGDTGQASLFD
ncbi:MAG: exodeoxyribonuclease VII large subunit [Sphingopyxis sp.]